MLFRSLRARYPAVGFFGDLGGMGRHDVHDGYYREHPRVHNGRVEGREPKAYSLAVAGVAILILAIGVVGYANHL